MPRYDDDSGDDLPRRKSGMSPGLVLGLVLGGVLFVTVIVGGLVFAVVAGPKAGATQRAADAAAARVWTRDEFRAAVMGKTPEEVIAAVGRPTSTSDHPDGSPWIWYYDGRVTNPATQQADDGILDFEGGRVAGVRW
jgi:hypothetical protein